MEATKKQSIFDISAELDQIAAAYDQLEELGTDEAVKESVMAYFGNLLEDRDALAQSNEEG